MEWSLDVVYAFTKDGQGGNAAGVVLDASAWSTETLQEIAAQAGFSETVFFCGTTEHADHHVRFFAPKREVALCGHGTIAGYSHLHQRGGIGPGKYQMQTLAGIQSVSVQDDGLISMTQNKPRFGARLDARTIAPMLGLDPSEIHSEMPIQIVSTGLNKILAPIRSLSAIRSIQPDLDAIERYSLKHEVTGIYTFTLETEQDSTAHCRNFAPAVGISEDAATGTSCAALSCLLYTYGQVTAQQATQLSYEQGYELGEPSEILASLTISKNTIEEVRVMGRATLREQVSIVLPHT